jgi:NAD(P)-dependent dehydrogenase (short-subunit alcohol dehydrogenase family)
MTTPSPVLLVTGGGRGIGAATARLGAQRGYAVAVNYVSAAAAAEALVAEIRAAGGQAEAIQADVGRPEEIPRLFDATERRLGRVTALVNSAGRTGLASRLEEASLDDIRGTIEVNVTGLILATREGIRRMSRRFGGPGGAIVNLSSAAATLGSTGEFVWYAASKAAVDIFTQGVAREVAEDGVRVNAVQPGLIDTDIHAAAGKPDRVARLAPTVPIRRAGSAEETARPILWLLSDEASYVTGAILRVAGGR